MLPKDSHKNTNPNISHIYMPPGKSVYLKIIFIISQPKQVLLCIQKIRLPLCIRETPKRVFLHTVKTQISVGNPRDLLIRMPNLFLKNPRFKVRLFNISLVKPKGFIQTKCRAD